MSSSPHAPTAVGRPSPADQRRLDAARALVARMDLPERIALLHQRSPGVARLGVGPFVTGTEGVHGVAWKGLATQFPQPVGMAASWDPALLGAAAAVTAAEVRERHAADPAVSLSVWAPVVNTLRHPLWGRTEEAYTEDPLLNAELASGFSRGLRGEGDTWQVLPTLKHFLAYSNETDRCVTDSQLSSRVLHEYELPGFVEPVARGLAASVMLSYNLVGGRPAHITDLLASQLRSRLPDPDLLFVVTDAGAPSNLFRAEKVVPDAASAHAAMLRAGADSFTDHGEDASETVRAVTEALERGLIEASHVDRAAVRQLVARARTGELDALPGFGPDAADGSTPVAPPPAVPATRAQRRALSREVATRSAVLLARRDDAALPLPDGPIAVLGEQAHTVLRDWYSGELHDPVPLARALAERDESGERVRTSSLLETVALDLVSTGAVPGVPGREVAPDPVLLATDASLRCSRPAADVPRSALPGAAAFEVLDLGEDVVALRETSTQLLVTVDDRGQLVASAERVGGWIVQETFHRVAGGDGTWQLRHLGSGRVVGLEHHTGALVLRAATPSADGTVPGAARFRPRVLTGAQEAFARATEGAAAVVLVIGNEPHVHGRETEDRPHVRLMGPDQEAAERLAGLGAEVATVLVITSSYPYDLEGLEERVGAVVWSSHAGEAEGEALADLLTGARDFSGRLAQTWPDSSPLPSVLDYDVITAGSTYLYGQGARFPLGHGLALDAPAWSGVRIEAVESGLQVELSLAPPARRRTAGPLHEVVQVYADVPATSFSRRPYRVPETRLIGFTTLEVPAGGTRAALEIPWRRLALYAPDLEAWELPDGPVTVRLARSATETVASATVHVPPSARETPTGPDAREIPAHRAEDLRGLSYAAATLLEGTELRPTSGAPGTADLVLPAGTEVTELLTRAIDLGALEVPAGTAALIDPGAADPSAAPALPLPHTVAAEGERPTGRVRVRMTGPIALTGVRVERP
ncbi:glycoside hydrolase family 3 protein [Brachybacterium sp. YJGR34]|uniref:glycoside hydrolase family 3 protein n=1 Tax=Brachybacterium sp. YJGR34 TaxID=2059911 RepID=UPI0018E6507B|nr:glycoside hydrolase family 3 protein [Brachybacterium sp. YJGR34]